MLSTKAPMFARKARITRYLFITRYTTGVKRKTRYTATCQTKQSCNRELQPAPVVHRVAKSYIISLNHYIVYFVRKEKCEQTDNGLNKRLPSVSFAQSDVEHKSTDVCTKGTILAAFDVKTFQTMV